MEYSGKPNGEGGSSAPVDTRARLHSHPLVKAGRLSLDDLAAVDTCESLSGSLEVRLADLGLSEGWVSQERTVPALDVESLGQPDLAVLGYTDDRWAEYRSTVPIGWEGPFLRVVMGGWEDLCGLLDLQLRAGASLQRFMADRESFIRALKRWDWPGSPKSGGGGKDWAPSPAADPLLRAWWEAGRMEPEPFRNAMVGEVEVGRLSAQAATVLQKLHAKIGMEFAQRSDRYGEMLTDPACYWGDGYQPRCLSDLSDMSECLGAKLLGASWLLDGGLSVRIHREPADDHRVVARMVAASRALDEAWTAAGRHRTLGENHAYFGMLHERIRTMAWAIPEPDGVDAEVAARIIAWRPKAEPQIHSTEVEQPHITGITQCPEPPDVNSQSDEVIVTVDGAVFTQLAFRKRDLWRLARGASLDHWRLGQGLVADMDSDVRRVKLSLTDHGDRIFDLSDPMLVQIRLFHIRLSRKQPDFASNLARLQGLESEWFEFKQQELLAAKRMTEQRVMAQKAAEERAKELELEQARAEAARAAEEEQQRRAIEQLKLDREAAEVAMRQTAAEMEARRQEALCNLRRQLRSNYPKAHEHYLKDLSDTLTEGEYRTERAAFLKEWVSKFGYGNKTPDSEQAEAVGAQKQHILLTARAGSGKTTTLVNRALFLIQVCGVHPGEILLLAFNREAARTIRERLETVLDGPVPHVMTFHALAYSLVHPEEALIYDDPEGSPQKTQRMRLVIDSFKRDPLYRGRIRRLMTSHFRGEWEQEVQGGWDKSPEEALHHRRTQVTWESIKGTPVKSFGEKLIADFLFEHNIEHWYEPNRKWGGINYRPDFIIPTGKSQGLVIEYFGLTGDPQYDEMTRDKRTYWAGQPGYQLLEFYPSDFATDGQVGFLKKLKQSIEQAGVTCVRLSEDEIWARIKERALNRFDRLVTSLVGRFRKLEMNPEQAKAFVLTEGRTRGIEPLEFEFLQLGLLFYSAYLENLDASGEEDFDGLMLRASELLHSGVTRFKRKSGEGDLRDIRHLLIDEYQDFSQLFNGVVTGIQTNTKNLNVFCVGDDWQAINGFAGSDLKFFQSFYKYFSGAVSLNLRTNYRSGGAIVNLGNRLMAGLGVPAVAHHSHSGVVQLADLAQIRLTAGEQERYPMVTITPAAIRLAHEITERGQRVVFLSRTNRLASFIGRDERDDATDHKSLNKLLELIREALPEDKRKWITISTAHSYKGKEEEVVVILDAMKRRYPLIHSDHRFFKIFGDSVDSIFEHERRLFYVALSRAKEQLILITESGNRSPFLDSLVQPLNSTLGMEVLNWEGLRRPETDPNIRRVQIRVQEQPSRSGSNSNEWGTWPVKEFLKAEDFKPSKEHRSWIWSRTTMREHLDLTTLIQSIWSQEGRGLRVSICTLDERPLAEYWVDRGKWLCRFDEIGLDLPAQDQGDSPCPF